MHVKRNCHTIELPRMVKEIRLKVGIQNIGEDNEDIKFYDAVIDTGATNSCISSKIVKDYGLTPDAETRIQTVNGEPASAPQYMVSFILPSGIKIGSFAIGAEPGVDILVGMDVISHLDFTMTHKANGDTIVSFAYPPFGKEIDFEKLKRK